MRKAFLIFATALLSTAQTRPVPTPAQGIANSFRDINRKVLDMAKDFPEETYNYRPSRDVRSFGEVVLHIMAGNTYATKMANGEPADWDKEEADPKAYTSKAAIIAAFQKSVDDSMAALARVPPAQFTKSLTPWLSVIEHSGEHYGQLVVYYRMNGLVPPTSRPQQK